MYAFSNNHRRLHAAVAILLASTAGTAQARSRVEVTPYIELSQQVIADIKGGDGDVLTYSTVAVGVDTSVATRRAEAQVSVRYERQISWQKSESDQDIVSGIARARVGIVGNTLSLEGGAIGTRVRSDGLTGANGNLNASNDAVSQVYSGYVGPTLVTHVGDLSVNAAYRFGYTKLDDDTALSFAGPASPDRFDHSKTHYATASVGMKPGVLPVGWAVGGGWQREDANQLDQRFDQKFARLDLTLPVSPTLALIGGVGYEKIEISQRDAVRDGAGVPVIGDDGRYVTDKSAPRTLSYDQDGLIWDAGVLWRPSRRSSAQFTVGRRYGSMSYTGAVSWNPVGDTSLSIAVYDQIDSFGRLLNNSLASLPTSFNAARNPFSGDLTGCAQGTQGGGVCFNNALSALGSGSFRNRGIAAQFATGVGGWNMGLGAGYAQRKFIASQGSVLASAIGTKDENYYVDAFVGRKIDDNSGVDLNLYGNYYDAGLGSSIDVLNVGAYASYYRNISRRLSATAAIGVDSVDPKGVEAVMQALGQVGLRYQF